MNKIISTTDRLFMANFGPSCCGKTELIFKMLLQNNFSPKFESIFYFYQHDQPKFQFIERNINSQFIKFSSFKQTSELVECLLVFDDSCEEIFNDKDSWTSLKNQCDLREAQLVSTEQMVQND